MSLGDGEHARSGASPDPLAYVMVAVRPVRQHGSSPSAPRIEQVPGQFGAFEIRPDCAGLTFDD